MAINKGKKHLWIEVKCPYEVDSAEWFELISVINRQLETYDDGKFIDMNAYLCDERSS